MKKLIQGIVEFRKTRRAMVRETFSRLALGQSPDCLFITCSDSRVAANVFASTDPGDLFVIRNVGNIVPAHPDMGSTIAALEYALSNLKVRHIIVCGHSDCGAIRALVQGTGKADFGPLGLWLRHAPRFDSAAQASPDDLSKSNVVFQLQNLRSHPLVQTLESAGLLQLHGLWFDIREADVLYLEDGNRFVLIDDDEGAKILHRLGP